MADPILLRGTLDLLVLKTLIAQPLNGFEIVRQLENRSGGALDLDDSALYQALHRMEERGHIQAEWGVSENNRRARYYQITTQGRKHLRVESARWIKSAALVADILGAATPIA